MTGIFADNNFKSFLKVDIFTLKISKIILLVFTLSMVLELAKLGKVICMLFDAIPRNMALDQLINLVFVFGTLSPLKSKNQGLYQISGKN